MEGMAAGTPVIARKDEGGAELIDEYGTGFLYGPEQGIAGTAQQIVGLHASRQRYLEMQAQCRNIAHIEFSMTRFGEKLLSLYQQTHA